MKKHVLLCLASLIFSAAFVLFLLVVIPDTRTELSSEHLEKIHASNDVQEIRGMATLEISALRSARDTGRVLSSGALTFATLMLLLSLGSLWMLRESTADPASSTPQTVPCDRT